jgi:hypothetical protein
MRFLVSFLSGRARWIDLRSSFPGRTCGSSGNSPGSKYLATSHSGPEGIGRNLTPAQTRTANVSKGWKADSPRYLQRCIHG